MELSESEKKILNLFAMYCRSYGAKVVNKEYQFYENSIDWQSSWTSNQSIMSIDSYDEIDNLMESLIDRNSLPKYENCGDYDCTGSLTISINCIDKTINFDFAERVQETDWQGTVFEIDELESINEWMDDVIAHYPNIKFGKVSYNGGGDSGEIDSHMEVNNQSINLPSVVEDLLYRLLENSYGGWEINEGSQGEFIFDFNEKSLTLNHGNNYEEYVNIDIDNETVKF